MPDKPKRRKNNRNKRKNKNQSQQNSSVQNVNVSVTDSVKSEKSPPSPTKQIDIDVSQVHECSVVSDKSGNKDESVTSSTNEGLCSNQIENVQNFSTLDIQNKIYLENKNIESVALDTYKVESPEKTIKAKPKLGANGKSKSADNDDHPIIVEISDEGDKTETDNSLAVVEACNVLITEIDPEVEWEKASDLKDLTGENLVPGALSITTIPLNSAKCDQPKSMDPEEEKTLRKYLQSLNLSTNKNFDSNSMEVKTELDQIDEREIKMRTKNNSFGSRLGPPRSLHVIDEEVSGESSATSRRHSYLNEKKSDDEELEDDVFMSSDNTKSAFNSKREVKTFTKLIPQKCIRVDAQIKDPEISEARGPWTTQKLESITGAEIVYLTDSSSSTSSTYDINETEENRYESDENVRIITPTIEVTNTDNYLKNNIIIGSNYDNSKVKKKLEECDKNPDQNIENITDINTSDHEIVVLATDNINTNLYVKDIDTTNTETSIELNSNTYKDNKKFKNLNADLDANKNTGKVVDQYDLEIKVLKCELNDAINNLIKEVISDSESVKDDVNESLVRQDSSSSVGSSQCTAKYNPKCSSLNDLQGDDFPEMSNECKQVQENKSHVKDVIESIENKYEDAPKVTKTLSLRNLCLGTICKLPYGEQILEELANVSDRLQKISDFASTSNTLTKATEKNINKDEIYKRISLKNNVVKGSKNVIPPPIKPRNSSLKITHEENSKVNVSQPLPKPYNICLSPSQKMLMEKTKTDLQTDITNDMIHSIQKPDDKKESDKKNVFDVPFKSQTGSRLLALLRKPSANSKEKSDKYECSSNFYSSSRANQTNKFDNIKISTPDLNNSKKGIDYDNSQSFKPIPPPKPRKLSSSFYECDQSTFNDSFNSIRQESKYLYHSTGNLSKDIEEDISSIQNMHRYYNNIYKETREDMYPRRPSLPKDLCDKQMEYILQKEKEVEAEIYRLENDRFKTYQRRGPRAPMITDEEIPSQSAFDLYDQNIKKLNYNNFAPQTKSKPETGKLSSVFSKSQEELVRNQMYTEYISQMAEREQRKQQKIIKITTTPHSLNNMHSKSETALKLFYHKVNNRIEKEFIDRAKERWNKLGFKDPETEDEKDSENKYREPQVIEHKIKVIDSGEEKDVQKLPNHLQDFVKFTVKDKSEKSSSPGESDRDGVSPHGVIVCAVIILLLTIAKYILRLFRRGI